MERERETEIETDGDRYPRSVNVSLPPLDGERDRETEIEILKIHRGRETCNILPMILRLPNKSHQLFKIAQNKRTKATCHLILTISVQVFFCKLSYTHSISKMVER